MCTLTILMETWSTIPSAPVHLDCACKRFNTTELVVPMLDGLCTCLLQDASTQRIVKRDSESRGFPAVIEIE